MFVGHYSVSFAVKSVDKSIPLWVLFLAGQFVDVLWATLVLLGIEKLRVVEGITASNALDLYYMPYTHSLVAALGWGLFGVVAYKLLRLSRTSAALLVGVAIFSHWLLDFLVHRPDLPIYDNVIKVGLGLWNYRAVALALEFTLLFVSFWFYLRATRAVEKSGKYAMGIFVAALAIVQLASVFGAAPQSDVAVAASGLSLYLVFAAIAFWLERKRM